MAYPTGIANGITAVECHKQVRPWRLLRSLIQVLVPTCNSTLVQDKQMNPENHNYPSIMTSSSTILTGTIFGYRRGKANLCIQEKPNSTNPLLLLQLPLPTAMLAKQMRGGTLRMVLESASPRCASNSCSCTLLSTPLWTTYCNGKKQGYAVKRRPSNTDIEELRLMRKVVAGAGIINGKQLNGEDHEVMYLRANFQRVRASTNSESFHLIDPEGRIGEELSVFFFGSA